MTKTEVIQRLQKDLKIPRFQAYIEDKEYSEERVQTTKKILKPTSPTTFQMFQQTFKVDWKINELYLKITYHKIMEQAPSLIQMTRSLLC